MCGITGIASWREVLQRRYLSDGCAALSHRGPDDSGQWWSADGRVGLGHRRLAIIDLSAFGHQPMTDASGRLVIVYNGEIYNFAALREQLEVRGHRFVSSSDTEVILAAYREWDAAFLERLNGMFALALFDADRELVVLARDRAGEKPLFYSLEHGTLRFGSELKALMADPSFPRRIDAESLDCFLGMGFVPGERCIVQGVSKLPPAHALTYCLKSGEATLRRYWELPAPPQDEQNNDDALADELEALLEDSVSRQLVADVPVGILLSGGVDSSLVTAMAVRAVPTVKTFTVRFAGYAAYDETEHARLIARHFGTEHLELEAPPSAVDLLPLLATQFDEPMADSSMVPTFLVSRLIRQHCTVALGGDGGDELFGGYPSYSRMLWLRDRARAAPRALCAAVGASAELLPLGFKGRNWLASTATDFATDVPQVRVLFDRPSRARMMRARDFLPLRAEAIAKERTPREGDLLQRATRMDFENYLPEDILVKVDRASMLNSLEVRAPFLDRRVIEFAFAKVPSRLKATPSARKILLKRLCSRILPPEFDLARKQGFSIPIGNWLRVGPWRDLVRSVLEAPDSAFEPVFVRRLLDGQRAGLANGERLFALTLFELWRKHYAISTV